MNDPSCDLCRLETITKEYYRCDDFVVLDCMNCKVPMIVANNHVSPMDFSDMDLRRRMYEKIVEVGQEFYKNDDRWYVDMQERNIPNHLHWHVRLPWAKRKHRQKR
jgi:hypothetical protein